MAASYNSWKEDVFTWARRCRLQMDLRNTRTRHGRLREKLEHLDERIEYLNMNIPERIPHIIGLLSRAWTAHPEWRLGQLVSNIMGPGPQDVFHLSDAGLEAGLHSILGHKIIPPAPSAEAQLLQSEPDAPPVQRGVSKAAIEFLEQCRELILKNRAIIDKHLLPSAVQRDCDRNIRYIEEILAALAHSQGDK